MVLGELPTALAQRAFGPAWLLALLIHVIILGAALLPTAPKPAEAPLVRLVFVEPPPPPPPPLGVPAGTGTTPAEAAVLPEPRAPETAKESKPVPPVEALPHRLKRVAPAVERTKSKPRPKAQVQPDSETARGPAVEAVAPGVPTGAADGVPGGVSGGVSGGTVGGTIGGTGSGPIPAGQVAHPPTVVHRVAPSYPEEARRREIEGLVVLEAILDESGEIEPKIRVVRSIPALDEAAIQAVKQWRFRPARDANDQAQRVILEVPIRFVLR